MTSSALALSILNLAGFRLLCTIGSFAGFAMILLGLLFDRKLRHSLEESHSQSAGPDPIHESSPAESRAPQEVVLLSEESGPTKSSDMSQQQKIAAALTRAGIANPADSTPSRSRAATALVDPETPTAADRTPRRTPISAQSTLPHRLILLSGSVLLLLSLILFLAIR
jgi:hypothetical protein